MFSDSYTDTDNVYLMIYKVECGNVNENIFISGMKQIIGNSTWIQITNIGNINGVNDKIYWALVRLD